MAQCVLCGDDAPEFLFPIGNYYCDGHARITDALTEAYENGEAAIYISNKEHNLDQVFEFHKYDMEHKPGGVIVLTFSEGLKDVTLKFDKVFCDQGAELKSVLNILLKPTGQLNWVDPHSLLLEDNGKVTN